MSDYSVSCDGVALDDDGVMFSIAVYTDGEGFNSYVYRASDVASRTAPNVQTELLDLQVWLTGIWRSSAGTLYVADADGRVRRFDGAVWTAATISSQALTFVWGLSDTDAYTAGDEGVVYRWDGAAWSAISPPLGNTVFSVRGIAQDNLYACGANGLLWYFDGSVWTSINLPTNQNFADLLAIGPGDTLVCGRGGVIFRGLGAAWQDVSQPGHDFHSLALYHGTIHMAGGGEGIFTFDGVTVTNIKDNLTSYRLAANGDYLASSGDTRAARFDGSAWFASRYS